MIEELIIQQEARLLRFAKTLIPNITADDLLQPFDYPQLEHHPYFRHEEGILEGLRTALTALRTHKTSWV